MSDTNGAAVTNAEGLRQALRVIKAAEKRWREASPEDTPPLWCDTNAILEELARSEGRSIKDVAEGPAAELT
jgi:hypothetical protein